MTPGDIRSALSAHFPADAVSWRVGSTTQDKSKGLALAYIDSRDVQGRLDDVVGIDNWQDEYAETSSGILICRLSIRINGHWVTKSDGAGKTDVEAEKGQVSDAFKRAAVKWGIGRYLYSLDSPWVKLEKGKYIASDELPRLRALLTRNATQLRQAPAQAEPPKSQPEPAATEKPSPPSYITAPAKDAKTLAIEKAERQAQEAKAFAVESAIVKRTLLTHLEALVPGFVGFDAEFRRYQNLATTAYRSLTVADKAVVTRAENKRRDQHREASAKAANADPDTGELNEDAA